MKTKQQADQTGHVLYTIEAFSTIGTGREVERIEVKPAEYAALKKHLASMRARKRAS